MTDQELPPPPVPADLDLTALAYMPLHVARLLSSETWLLATGDEAKAAMTLWARAWHQVPAGSLPDDDRLLSLLSGAGSKWKRVRALALRGFKKHSDGRLYHEVICEEATEANEKRIKWREKKRRQREGQSGGQPEGHGGGRPGGQDGGHSGDVMSLRDGTGRYGKNSDANASGAGAPPSLPLGDEPEIDLQILKASDGDWSKLLFGEARQWLAKITQRSEAATRNFIGKCLKECGNDHRSVFEIVALAQAQKPPLANPTAWIAAAVKRRGGAQPANGSGTNGARTLPAYGPGSEFERKIDEWHAGGCQGDPPRLEDYQPGAPAPQ